jgi:predicted flap endonuclease-1-like 5' DNA nuclease
MNSETAIIVVVASLVLLILGFLLLRPRKQRIDTKPRGKAEGFVASRERPYVKAKEGDGVTGEAAAAATDVAGEVLGVDAHRALSGGDGAAGPADDLQLLKGVGPKFAARLHELGITRYAQLAGCGDNELALLDEKLGPFRGRLARDRIAEQADYLARGDMDGFEERFGKLGGA